VDLSLAAADGLTRTDDLASAGVHALGLLLALASGAYLLSHTRAPAARFSVRVLSAAWLMLYLASIFYHVADRGTFWRAVGLAFDDGAIFVAIAGTYTPFVLLAVRPAERKVALTVLWAAAAAGVAATVTAISAGYVPWYQPSVLFLGIVFGWGPALVYCRTLTRSRPQRIGPLVLASGLVYVAGAYFYREHGVPWHHTYWHIAIVLGCLLDFVAVAALLGAPSRIAPSPISPPMARQRGATDRARGDGMSSIDFRPPQI
jgi:hemolysin III